MQNTYSTRKVVAPTLPAVLLHRTALMTRLHEAILPDPHKDTVSIHYKLILCCAPAGYGKTTLLADFARTLALPCCWYFFEPADTDPVVFLRTFLTSIRHALPQFGASLDPLFSTIIAEKNLCSPDIYQSIIDALCTDLASEVTQRLIIIFCNYEEVNESKTLTDLIDYLLQKLPPLATLIIESRVVPNISFTSLIMHDEICGLDRDALRFSAPDIVELARSRGLATFTDDEAEKLASSFDGWITGILLGTRLGDVRLRLLTQDRAYQKHPSLSQEKSLAEQRRKTLFTYLVNEVLKQDRGIHAFLQTISILPQILPAMCNTLLGIEDAGERLARLEGQGLFLTSYEDVSAIIYTCQPVIRDLLSEQLHQQEPERFVALHRQAAELWRACNNYEMAMYHALTIQAYAMAASLILDAFEQLLQQGQQETLMRWLHALPASLQEHHPRLLLIQATIALERGQHTSALPLLDRAQELLPAVPEKGCVLQATIAILRSKALFLMGAYTQAQELCHQALRQLAEEEYALRAAATMRLGICANLEGHFMVGITYLQQALHIWANKPPPNQAIHIHNALANTYYLLGNFALTQHHLTHMLNACEQLHDIQGKVDALILQGLLSQDQGFTTEAEAAFLQALTLARTVPYAQRGEAYALVNLGSLFVQQRRYAEALTHSEKGLLLARQWGNRSLTNAALLNLAMSYLFLGDAVSALLAVDQMETQTLSNGSVGYERAWRNLTYGMILLAQGRSDEAEPYLVEIEAALHATDFKLGSIQAKLRLAACRVAQDQLERAHQLLTEVSSLLATHQNYIYLAQLELQLLPTLLTVVQKSPQLASLRTHLGIDEPLQLSEERRVVTASEPPLTVSHAPRLVITAFGEPTVVLDEQPVKHWRMARAMELFFFLLDSAHPVSKEVILTALWPEYNEQTSPVFHNTVYQLRKILGETCVVFGPAGYSLDLTTCYGKPIFYDVQAFEQYQAEAAQAMESADETGAKEALLKMVQLYRGDYGRSFYNDWCTFRRDELRTAYLEARCQLAHITWNAEDWNESAEHWRHILRLDSCHEDAHYGLMRCYARQGQRGAALRQYRACQKILQQELGVQPGQVIQHFYQRLIAKGTSL